MLPSLQSLPEDPEAALGLGMLANNRPAPWILYIVNKEKGASKDMHVLKNTVFTFSEDSLKETEDSQKCFQSAILPWAPSLEVPELVEGVTKVPLSAQWYPESKQPPAEWPAMHYWYCIQLDGQWWPKVRPWVV